MKRKFDDFEEIEELEEEPKKRKSKKKKVKDLNSIYNTIINAIFVIVVLLIIMVALDVVLVAKYEKGPYFAIPTVHYKDGGTKEYMGLGYKVIKYNALQGRKGTVIGSWSLKYDNEPLELTALDLAIAFTNDSEYAYNNYYKEYLQVSGTYQTYSDKQLVFGYNDAGGKYSLKIVCNMNEEAEEPQYSLKNINVNAVGTLFDYKEKSGTEPKTVYLKDCFTK